jgi:hypothetical protein
MQSILQGGGNWGRGIQFTSRAILEFNVRLYPSEVAQEFKIKFERIHFLFDTNLSSPPQQQTETIECGDQNETVWETMERKGRNLPSDKELRNKVHRSCDAPSSCQCQILISHSSISIRMNIIHSSSEHLHMNEALA